MRKVVVVVVVMKGVGETLIRLNEQASEREEEEKVLHCTLLTSNSVHIIGHGGAACPVQLLHSI